MKQLAKRCSFGLSCPAVFDPEDNSGELVIIGRRPLTPADEGVTVVDGEAVVRISRKLIEEALNATNQSL